MKVSRSEQLHTENGVVHSFWRCHNKEHYLRPNKFKRMYMRCVQRALASKSACQKVKIHAFCVMDNHYHQIASYSEGSTFLSGFFRVAHTIFGMKYNFANKRTGKVAESRPKTPLIQDTYHEMQAQFYTDANPVDAKICTPENLKYYKFSSFKFYAYGICDEFTSLLTPPDWYLQLGTNNSQRQKKYRQLFYRYLQKSNKIRISVKDHFIGTVAWVQQQIERVRVTRLSLSDSQNTS